jgi:hypothetical protein
MTTSLVPIPGAGPVKVVDSHMDGWQAFGAAGDDISDDKEPVLHRLGGTEHWPEPELHNGIAAISLSIYGDDPRGAFVSVTGPDRGRVLATYEAVVSAIRSGVAAGWFA